MSARKRTRTLNWTPEADTVSRYVGADGKVVTVSVGVRDTAEHDRRNVLVVSADDAVYLAGRLAQMTGHKLVQA